MILGKVGTHIVREWNWIKALNARPKTIKPLGETGENFLDLGMGNYVMTPKAPCQQKQR